MKLLTSYHSSSSSPSSSSSTLSATTTVGCLSAILRRILCSSGLPTHPSDQIRELDSMLSSGKDQELKGKRENTEEATTTTTGASATTLSTPGVVAKLMGLESNLEIIPFKATQSSSLSRSQSMNSVAYFEEIKKPMKGTYRRVKSSSSSFCEVPPTFHLHENENFLVLSFESGCESKEFKSKGRKKDSCSAELKRNKRGKVHEEEKNGCVVEKVNYLSKRVSDLSSINVGNDGEFQSIGNSFSMNMLSSDEKECLDSEVVKVSSQPLKLKEVLGNGEKVKRRKKGKTCRTEKKVENECSSEDSSPVSVFDFEREPLETEVDSLGVDLSWRRKLSPELENELLFVLHSDSNLMVEERKVNKAIGNNKKERLKKKEKQSQDCADIWGEICRLVESDLVGSNQMEPAGMRKQGDFDSISADFESEIFDYLLNELIDQLVFSS